jgi:hypothetical protein
MRVWSFESKNKTLKFRPQFVEHIRSKNCGITTRMFDENNISEGDVLDLVDSATDKKFITAKVSKVYYRPFGEVAKEAADPQGLYRQYQDYYGHKIEPDMPIKFIHFDIIGR